MNVCKYYAHELVSELFIDVSLLLSVLFKIQP